MPTALATPTTAASSGSAEAPQASIETVPAAPREPPELGDGPWLRLAGWLIGLGAFGVVLASACYAMAGPEAALPGGAATPASAIAATAGAAGWMRAAGLLGMPGDLLLAVGATLMARCHPSAPQRFAGWSLLALTSALFVFVDTMVGFVLPSFAGSGALAAYAAMRLLFDTLFLIGTWALGLGALAVTAPQPVSPRGSNGLLRLAGWVALASSSAGLLGWAMPLLLVGPSIALAAAALVTVGAALACSHRRQVPV